MTGDAMKKNATAIDDMRTIQDVMSDLGLGRSTVLGLGGRYLHPVKMAGKLYYRADEVAAERERREGSNKILRKPERDVRLGTRPAPLPEAPPVRRAPAYDGKIAAQAVRLFRDGADRRGVVEKLEISFELAEHLWLEYQRVGPEVVLDSRALETLKNYLSLYGKVMTAEIIVMAVKKLLFDVERRSRELADEMSDWQPHVTFSPKTGRVKVEIRSGTKRIVDGAVSDWSARFVDVTDVLAMTSTEMKLAEWVRVSDSKAAE
jgi:hypothetical protein